MERTTVMTARVFAPAGLVLLAAVALVCADSKLAGQPLLQGIATALDWVVVVALIAAFGLAIHAVIRLWRWERGDAHDCPSCGGLLGWEREGRHGPYRKCLGCRKNIARINYTR
jgi:hypothetical protein